MIKKSLLVAISAAALLGAAITSVFAATPEEAQAMAEKAAALGSKGYLMKPFAADALVQQVTSILPLTEKAA